MSPPVGRAQRRPRRGAGIRARARLERLPPGVGRGSPPVPHAPRGEGHGGGHGQPGDGGARRPDGARPRRSAAGPLPAGRVGRLERQSEEGRGGGRRRGAPDRRGGDDPGAARGAGILDLRQLLLPDEHAPGRAALRDRDRVRRPVGARDRPRPLLGDGRDQSPPRPARSSRLRRRARDGGDRGRRAQRPGQRDHQLHVPAR